MNKKLVVRDHELRLERRVDIDLSVFENGATGAEPIRIDTAR